MVVPLGLESATFGGVRFARDAAAGILRKLRMTAFLDGLAPIRKRTVDIGDDAYRSPRESR